MMKNVRKAFKNSEEIREMSPIHIKFVCCGSYVDTVRVDASVQLFYSK